MKKSRFSETQIVAILKEAESGIKIDDLCRKHGISSATYHNWKSKYGGMEALDLKKMKELEAELNQLKKMYAGLSLENYAIKELLEKNTQRARRALTAADKREAVTYLVCFRSWLTECVAKFCCY